MIRAPDPGQWADLCAAFDALVELDAGARTERLAAIGASDPAARRALEELLEGDASAGDRLGRIEAIFGTTGPSANRDVLQLVGRTIGHFCIVEPLAAGGMGVVYRAIDTHLGRPVALKFPLPGQRLDRQVRERFLREARAAGALDHPNICSIYETGETEDGQLFLAMPLYEGETLKARIVRAGGGLPIAEALAIAVQIAQGLHAAHRAGIVHRDLKPGNAMILADGRVKILDFGIARVGDGTLTASHGTLGTVAYMAPEQVRGEQLDGRADLWALGVLLYEMLTGRRPFEGQQDIAIAHAIVHANPVRPSVLRPDIWPELDALVLGLLARQPRNRPASAAAVAAELTGLASESVPRKVRRWRAPVIGSAWRPLVWAATAALVVTAVGTVAWLFRAGAGSRSTEPRIVAVLPFEGSSVGDDTDYLAVALADAIATQLSRFGTIAVSGESSGAAALVRVSVRRTGEEVRLEVELFDVGRNGRVWTREYRGPASTVLALQWNATDGIVAALGLHLTRSERDMLKRVPTASAQAYDLYLRGRAAQLGAASRDSSQRVANLLRAQSYYARARENDPTFAAPRASLALSLLALARDDRTSARSDQARLEAEAALRLEPGIPEAHEALATYWALRGERPNATTELERALVGRPNATHLYLLLGVNLRQLGRWEEAVSAFERASRLDPRNSLVHTEAAFTYARLRRYDEAIAHWDRVIAIDSARNPFPQIIRGFAYLRRGDVDSLDAAISRIPLGLDYRGLTTYAHYTLHRIRGRHAEALASLDSARFAISSDNALLYRPVTLMRAQTLERMGDPRRARLAYQAARALLEDSVAAHPREAMIRVALGLAYAGLHRRADAMREARTATELVPVSENTTGATAAMGGAVEILAQLGEADAALELIELLLAMPAGREISVPLLRLDPTFDPLRSDPRFDALLARFSRN
ncbi:MAG TPA: protein kinase [Gemmatimonadales bacterium]|nr:protein kinase [Gemmatimonadales bacterium]